MGGRNRVPYELFEHRRAFPTEERVPRGHFDRLLPPHPALLQEEYEIRLIELRRLVKENQGLVDDRVALEQELSAVKEELRRMNVHIHDMRADQELQCRELIERGMKLEAELRDLEPLKNEAAKLQAEVKRLNIIRQDLSGQVKTLSKDLGKLQADNQQIPVLKTEIDGHHQEMIRARSAIEYEKNANIELLGQRQAMENNMVTMAREVEKLRSELASSGARAWSSGGPYGMNLSYPDANLPAPFGDGYGLHLGATDKGYTYGSSSTSRRLWETTNWSPLRLGCWKLI